MSYFSKIIAFIQTERRLRTIHSDLSVDPMQAQLVEHIESSVAFVSFFYPCLFHFANEIHNLRTLGCSWEACSVSLGNSMLGVEICLG
mmetsp:Transcript_28771/g.44717  ORF Transcript_28771/g.44717 Transcript_28771/m.44717 type:complete len:88 (+) Transcript_28771:1191-1454(+)